MRRIATLATSHAGFRARDSAMTASIGLAPGGGLY
jgi:hypothetical protein